MIYIRITAGSDKQLLHGDIIVVSGRVSVIVGRHVFCAALTAASEAWIGPAQLRSRRAATHFF